MKLTTLIKDITEDLNHIARSFPMETMDFNDPIQKEYWLTTYELRYILKVELNNTTDDVLATSLSARLFIVFCARHFNRVDKTPAAPWLMPKSAANQLSYRVAKRVASFFLSERLCEMSAMQLYIPALKVQKSNITGNAIEALNPSSWILSESGYPVEIQTCLKYFSKNGTFMSTCKIDGERRALSPQDIALVTNHSFQAKGYVKSCQRVEANRNATIDKWKSALNIALKGDAYKITASYGPEGIDRLNERVNVDYLQLDKSADIDYQRQALLTIAFLRSIDTNLLKVALDNVTSQERDKLLYSTELYRRELEMRASEYVGPTVFGYGWGVGKTNKLEAVDVFQSFLVSNAPLHELRQYLKDNALEEHCPAFYNKNLFRESTLCRMVAQAEQSMVMQSIPSTPPPSRPSSPLL